MLVPSSGLDAPAVPPVRPPTSGRQAEILALIAAGKTDKEIAALLHLSVTTVRTYLRRMYAALGVHCRAQAVAIAMSTGRP